MKFLICLSVILAVANAGLLHGNAVYGSGAYSTGSLISAPAAYVQSAPAVHIVRQPISSAVYAAPGPVYHSAPIYRSAPLVSSVVSAPVVHSAPIISAPVVHAAPIISAPALSHSYGLTYGAGYGSAYGLGGIVRSGFLKRQ